MWRKFRLRFLASSRIELKLKTPPQAAVNFTTGVRGYVRPMMGRQRRFDSPTPTESEIRYLAGYLVKIPLRFCDIGKRCWV
jgi:hypothetical protein